MKKMLNHDEMEKNIGLGIYKLVVGLKPADATQLGKVIRQLLSASVKASLAGEQTNAQIADLQAKAMKAFARALARKVKTM